MKIRELLKRFDLWLRPAHVRGEHGEGYRPVDNVDALTTVTLTPGDPSGSVAATAPPNWVPSQQDDRPPH
jgi:hypothetical protein